VLSVFDVVFIGVVSVSLGMYDYRSIKKILQSDSIGLTGRQTRRKQKLEKKELWEHAALSTAKGIGMFLFMIFLGMTNFSHLPTWIRIVFPLTFAHTLFAVVNKVMHLLFLLVRKYRVNTT